MFRAITGDLPGTIGFIPCACTYGRPDRPSAGERLLQELQANILTPHGRKHAVMLFLRFQGDRSSVRRWLSEYAAAHLTTAWSESQESRPSTMIHIALSADGYRHLEIAPDSWPKPAERPGSPDAPDVFRSGMRQRMSSVSDATIEDRDPAFQFGVHALILAASDDPTDLIRTEWNALAGARGIAAIVAIERAFDDNGAADFTPPDAASQLLTADPAGENRVSYGSYLVFRKLEHNLRESKAASERIAQRFGIGPEAALVLAQNDPSPFASSAWQTVARRSHRYGGNVAQFGGSLPARGHGILSLCYQANIREQYEAAERGAHGLPDPSNASWTTPSQAGLSLQFTLRGGEYLFSPCASFFRGLLE